MTLSNVTNKVSYAGDGATVAFAIPFPFLETGHIEAVLRDADGAETVWTLNSEYTLTGAGVAAGGTLTVETSPTDHTPAAGETLVIRRVVLETQETDYPEGGAFPAAAHEQALDKLTMLVQQNSEAIGRSLSLPVSTPLSDVSLPEPGAGGVIRWNQAGTALDTVALGDLSLDIAAAVEAPAPGDRLVYDGTLWRNRPAGAIDVRDFGAVGDGATDDTAAIEAALGAGDDIYLPPGDYLIATAMTIPDNKRLFGPGRLMMDDLTAYPRMITVGSGCTIEGLKVLSTIPWASHPDPSFAFFLPAETTDCTFRDVDFEYASDSNSQGIFADVRCKRIRVLNCTQLNGHTVFTTMGGEHCQMIGNRTRDAAKCIQVVGGRYHAVANNTGINATVGVAFWSDRSQSYYGSASLPGSVTRSAPDNLTFGNLVVGNVVENDSGGSPEEGISFDCHGNEPDSWPEHSDDPVVTFASSSDVGVTHQITIDETGQAADWCNGYYAVVLTGDAAGNIARIDDSEAGQISVFNGGGGFASAMSAGDNILITTGFLHNTVVGNTVRQPGTGGIIFWGSSWNNVVEGNTVIGSKADGITVASVVGQGNVVGGGTENISCWSGKNLVQGNTVSLGFGTTAYGGIRAGVQCRVATLGSPYDIATKRHFGNVIRNNVFSTPKAIRVGGPSGVSVGPSDTVIEGNVGPENMEIALVDTTNTRLGTNLSGGSNIVPTLSGTNTGLVKTNGRLSDDDESSYIDMNAGENTAQVFIEGTEIARVTATGLGIGIDPGVPLHVEGSGNTLARVQSNGGAVVQIQAQAVNGFMGTTTNGQFILTANNSGKLIIEPAGGVRPAADNSQQLGNGSFRWSEVFAGTGTINTSDAREKRDIAGLDPASALAMLRAFDPVSHKWNDIEREAVVDEESGTVLAPAVSKKNVRTHYGFVAQQVESALEGLGLTTGDFAPLVHDPDSDRYGLRYDQLVPILWAALRDVLARLEALEG